MKRLPFLILLVLVAGSFFAFKNKLIPEKKPVGKYELIMTMVAKLLSQVHYDPKDINDEFSEKVFAKYLEDLDPRKDIFLKTDVDSLAGLYAKRIDDELNGAPVESFIGVSKVFDQRIAESAQWKNLLLAQPFDFTIDENAELNGKKIAYPANSVERKDRWRKLLKYYVLERFSDLQEGKGNAKSSKPDAQLEKEARGKTDTMMTRMFDRYKVKFTEEDKFNLFVDNITTAMDPHSEFFPPADKSYFDEE